MPTFDFTSPEGKTYSVDGPEGATKEQAFQILQSQLGGAATSPHVGYGEDLAKAAATIPGRIAAGLAGIPGDLAYLYAPKDSAPNPVGSAAIRKGLSSDYEAQRLPGQLLQTGGDYLPAVIGGPESLAVKLATRVAAPAVASEAAGALTQGTPLEMPARVASAFLGSYGASKAIGALKEAQAVKNAAIPAADLRSQTSSGYDALRDANVGRPLPEGALEDAASRVRADLNAKNQRPINAPELHTVLDKMETPATAGSADVADLLAARSAFKDQFKTNPAGAHMAIDSLDKAIESYSPSTISQLKELDKNWTGVRSGEALDKNLAIAERRAAGANSGLNLGNTIRQRVNSFLSSAQARYLSDDAKAALEKVNAGTATQNTLRDISNMLGKGHGLGGAVAGEIIGHIFGNDLLGLAIGTVSGRATNALYTRSVASSAKKAADAIRGETPAGQQFAQAKLPSKKMTPTEFNAAIKAARIEHRRQAAIPAALAGVYAPRRSQ